MNHLDWINQPLIAIGRVQLTTKGLLLSTLVLLVGMWLARRVRRYMLRHLGPMIGLEKSTVFTLATLAFYAITALTLVFAFSLLGFDFTNLAIIAGALSVGIGFGLQDIAKNFISGLLLLFDRSIKVGDYIELSNGGLRGTVEQIRVRSTIVRTNDELDVIVPNSQFLTDQVVNWTLSSDVLRLHVPFGVAYGSDVERLRDIMLKVAGELPNVVKDDDKHRPKLWFTSMGDSSLNFELLVWVQGEAITNYRSTLSEYTFAVHRTLIDNGYEIPFPQRDVHIKSAPESAAVPAAAPRRKAKPAGKPAA
jgi:small-conductance mechanosensitive channel